MDALHEIASTPLLNIRFGGCVGGRASTFARARPNLYRAQRWRRWRRRCALERKRSSPEQRRRAMLYFPGPTTGSSGRPPASGGNGAALDRGLPRATLKGPTHVPPRGVPASDPRMRSLGPNFSGSLDYSGAGMRPGTGGDPASPVHRDAAAPGSRGNTTTGHSPYGNVAPRHTGGRPKGYGNARGAMQRPSQQMS